MHRGLGVLALCFALAALASPLRHLWMRDDAHWLLPFAVWALVIGVGAWAARREGT